MTDDRNRLPDIPAEAAAQIIAAAAKISGKAAGDLNLEQAIAILQKHGERTGRILFNRIAKPAAAALFSDPDKAAQFAAAIHEKATQEAAAETIAAAIAQELEPQIKHGLQQLRDALDIVASGKPAARCTKKQKRTLIEAAAFISGQDVDSMDASDAAETIGGILDSMSRDKLNDLLQQEGLKPIRPAENQQQEGAEPVKENPAADAPGDDPDDAPQYYIETDENGRDVIRIQAHKYDPTLDPDSPEFDPEKWKAATAAASERLKETAARLQKAIAEAMQPALKSAAIEEMLNERCRSLADSITEPLKRATTAAISPAISPAIEAIQTMTQETQERLNQLAKSIMPTFTGMQNYFNSDTWKETRDALARLVEQAQPVFEIAEEITELTPYLEAELKKPKYEGKDIDTLFNEAEADDDGNPLETSLAMQAIIAARAARDAAIAKENPPHAAIKRAEIVEYPLDKPNSIIWNLLEKDTKGQISFDMATDKDKRKGISLPAYYAINFEDLGDNITTTKRLLPFDKRVYIAVSALFNAGNNVITLSQIFYAMGYTGRPAAKHLTKINDAITKMTGARIFFDNRQEVAKYKYDHFKYDGSLLPLERGTAIVNGQLADAAIHIFREPPLITFAKQRQQITTVDVKLLQSPINKTDANLLIDDYLLGTISRKKRGKNKHCRMLFKTIYARTNITTKKQEQRAPDKIKRYLDYYQQQKFITRYAMEKDGITVYWQ